MSGGGRLIVNTGRAPRRGLRASLAAIVSVAMAAVALTSATPAVAAEQVMIESAAAWRLQNYVNNNVVIWFTSSGCPTGQLVFPGATTDDLNRLWSTVLSAKIAHRSVGISFNKIGDSCQINSFWVDG